VRAVWVTALIGCGRLGFEPVGDVDMTNVPAVCGDGICAGASGELCSTCTDCITTADVCGNAECSPGETGVSCYADCGPSPWPWQSDSATMLAAINNARSTGVVCPGASSTVTAPALSYDVTFDAAAREWAWEAAHGDWVPANGCNGRAATERVNTAGASSIWKSFDTGSGAAAIASLLAFAPSCTEMMAVSNTKFAGASAYDLVTAHAIVLR
jgi:hypothetical protein